MTSNVCNVIPFLTCCEVLFVRLGTLRAKIKLKMLIGVQLALINASIIMVEYQQRDLLSLHTQSCPFPVSSKSIKQGFKSCIVYLFI